MGKIKIEGYICERCRHKWTSRENSQGEPHVCPKCLPPDSIISGDFKSISEYKKGDIAYCYSGKKEEVKKVFQHNYKGRLIEIRPQGCFPIKATPNHKVLAIHVVQKSRSKKRKFSRKFLEPEWIFAENLKKKPVCENKNDCGDYLIIPKIKGIFADYKIDLQEFTSEHGLKVLRGKGWNNFYLLTNESAWLLGLYVAEGTSSKGRGELQFYLGKHEKKLIQKTINVIKNMGFSYNCRESRTAMILTLYSRVLCRAFKKWCGKNAHSKKIPDFIMHHSKLEIVSSFLKGYLEGDGYIRNCDGRIGVKAGTLSKILALQLQLLGIRMGGFFRINKVDFSKYISNYKGRLIKGGIQYVLAASAGPLTRLMGENKMPRYNKSYKFFKEYVAVPVNSVKEIPYQGKVMNLETEEGNYLVSNITIKNCKSPYWNIPRKQPFRKSLTKDKKSKK